MKKSILFFAIGISLIAACAGIEWLDRIYEVPLFMITAIAVSLWKITPFIINKYVK